MNTPTPDRNKYQMFKSNIQPTPIAAELQNIPREELIALVLSFYAPTSWTIRQTCDYLHISEPTFHRLVVRGVLHPKKVGRRTLLDPGEVRGLVERGDYAKNHHPKRK